MNILITGANSYVGTHVAQWLEQAGHHVDTVDTLNDQWMKAPFGRYDTVFHVAGIAHVNAKASMRDLYYQVNCELAIHVAQTAKEAGVRQFIFMSSMIVYHESQSLQEEVITADTQPCPNGFYGDSKWKAEKGLLPLESPTFRVCILRPPMIYGPHSKGNFPRLISLAKKTPIFPAFHNQRSMLYIDNLAEFVRHATERQLSGIYFPQNAQQADTVEIIQFFAKAYHHRVCFCRWLNPLVRVFSHVIQPLNKMFATYYYSPQMSQYDFHYQIVSFEESLRRILSAK